MKPGNMEDYIGIARKLYAGMPIDELAQGSHISKNEIIALRDEVIKNLFAQGFTKDEVLHRLGLTTNEYHEAIARRYQAIKSKRRVASEFHVSYQQVSEVLKKYGIQSRPPGRPRTIDHEYVREKYRELGSEIMVAEELGINAGYVSRILRNL